MKLHDNFFEVRFQLIILHTTALPDLTTPAKYITNVFSFISEISPDLITGDGPKFIYEYFVKPAFQYILGDSLANLGLSDDEIILRLLANIVPILSVSEPCSYTSWTVLFNAFLTDGGLPDENQIPWALKSKLINSMCTT